MHMQFILMVYKCLFTALHNIVIPRWKIPGCISKPVFASVLNSQGFSNRRNAHCFFLKQGSVFRRKMMTPFLALSDFVQAPAPLCDKALLLKVLKGASASLE